MQAKSSNQQKKISKTTPATPKMTDIINNIEHETKIGGEVRPLAEADRLTDKNYGDWSFQMKSLLRISKTWERIENSTGGAATVAITTKEKDEEEFAQYLIINSITSPQRANVPPQIHTIQQSHSSSLGLRAQRKKG